MPPLNQSQPLDDPLTADREQRRLTKGVGPSNSIMNAFLLLPGLSNIILRYIYRDQPFLQSQS